MEARLADILQVLNRMNEREQRAEDKAKATEQAREAAKAAKETPDTFAGNVADTLTEVQNQFKAFQSLLQGNLNQLPKHIAEMAGNLAKQAQDATKALLPKKAGIPGIPGDGAAPGGGIQGISSANILIQSARVVFANFGGGGQQGGGGIGNLLENRSQLLLPGPAGEAAGAGAEAAGGGEALAGAGAAAAGGSALAGVGAVIAGAAALGIAFAALVKSVKDTATAFLESQRKFAEYNAQLAAVFAQWDIFNMQMTMNMGEGLAQGGGLEFLEGQLEGFLTTLTPYLAAFTNLLSYILGAIVAVFDFLLKTLEAMMMLVADGFDKLTFGVLGLHDRVERVLKEMRKSDMAGSANDWFSGMAAEFGTRPVIGPRRAF